MPFADEATVQAYRQAWEDWRKQLDHLHRVFLEGELARPDQLKGLLNREARAKERYDAARLRLLGLDEPAPPAPGEGDANPFC
ncbi:MAG: hypothetical protein HY875_16235 [Chloroflexi bacterium]|nr:hypothetical protein [Chloroflexota bacterium]